MSTPRRLSLDILSHDPPVEEDGEPAHDTEAQFKAAMVGDEENKPDVADIEKAVVARASVEARNEQDLQDALNEDAWAISPHNPYTWTTRKKWTMTSVVALYTLVS
jgi:hypothetical protein